MLGFMGGKDDSDSESDQESGFRGFFGLPSQLTLGPQSNIVKDDIGKRDKKVVKNKLTEKNLRDSPLIRWDFLGTAQGQRVMKLLGNTSTAAKYKRRAPEIMKKQQKKQSKTVGSIRATLALWTMKIISK